MIVSIRVTPAFFEKSNKRRRNPSRNAGDGDFCGIVPRRADVSLFSFGDARILYDIPHSFAIAAALFTRERPRRATKDATRVRVFPDARGRHPRASEMEADIMYRDCEKTVKNVTWKMSWGAYFNPTECRIRGTRKGIEPSGLEVPSQIRALYSDTIMPAECYNFDVFIAVASWKNTLRTLIANKGEILIYTVI